MKALSKVCLIPSFEFFLLDSEALVTLQSPESMIYPYLRKTPYSNRVSSLLEKPVIAELRNGKVVFKQKPISLEQLSETLQGVT